jgi:hypothetical protein
MTILEERSSPSGPEEHRDGGSAGAPEKGSRAWLIVAIVAVAALICAAFVLGRSTKSTTSTTPTVAPTTTSTVATTASTQPTVPPSTAPTVDLTTAVWPTTASGVLYTDPVAAARGFAVDFVGFVDPVVGEFKQGDSRSGEVDIRPNATGPITTVFVRQLSGSDSWWVLGAATPNIVMDQPATGSTVSSPAHLTGTSTAFEANVAVSVREDGQRAEIGHGFVMGGSNGEMGPFDGTVAFTTPSAPQGAVVMYTVSMENGQVWEASVVRVQFSS